MNEPKSIEEIPSWVIVNALKCPIEAQISIVAKLLQHLDCDQKKQVLSLSGIDNSYVVFEDSQEHEALIQLSTKLPTLERAREYLRGWKKKKLYIYLLVE
jgi:hypothetical protein